MDAPRVTREPRSVANGQAGNAFPQQAAARAAKWAAERERRETWLHWLQQHSPITVWGDEHKQIGHAARKHGIDFVEGQGTPGVPQIGREFFRVFHVLQAMAAA